MVKALEGLIDCLQDCNCHYKKYERVPTGTFFYWGEVGKKDPEKNFPGSKRLKRLYDYPHFELPQDTQVRQPSW